MRWDIENQLSVAQAFTGAATVSTNSFDKQTAKADPSIGRRMALLLACRVAQGASSTLKVEAIQADDAALTSNVAVLATLDGTSGMKVGDFLEIPIPQGVMSQRYIGARVTLTTGTTTITADIYYVPQDEIPKFETFPKVVGSAV